MNPSMRRSVDRLHHPLLVLAPLGIEARAVRAGLAGRRPRPGEVLDEATPSRTPVVRTGMGPRRAARAAKEAKALPAGAVAIAGFCGALDHGLEPGRVVVATEVRGPAGTRACPSAPLLAAAVERLGVPVALGPIVSVSRPGSGGRRERLRGTGAVAVDMESAWLAEAAGDRPLAVLRAVVDTPDRELTNPLATATGGMRAYRSLRAAAPALDAWSRAVRPRRVLLAGPRSFCAGVDRAIEIVERALERHGPPVYVRKQIVHNVHVVRDLEARGAVFVESVDQVPDGSLVVFSAHGVSPEVRNGARARDLRVIDATCPLVTKVHSEARRFSRAGYTIFLVGHRGHEEVEGTTGEAPDSIRVIDGAAGAIDPASLHVEDPAKVAYLTQTTLAVDEVSETVGRLRERFPDLVGPGSDDICYATQNRQDAVKVLAGECDLLLVIGSDNSSNSRRLVEVSERQGCPAHLIDDEKDVDLRWLADAAVVGVTAGASAPEVLVERVVAAIAGLGPAEVEERHLMDESVRFTLPADLR